MGGQTPAQQSSASRSGLLYGAGAYIWWGLCPGFFLLLLPAGAPEVLAHRIVWSALLLLLVLAVARRLGDLRRLPRRTWLQLLGAAVLISVNWGTYIFAVTTGHVVDAALGYFINPLVSVLLGVLVFRERINRWQAAALVLALVAVVILTVELGAPPYIAVVLALSFGVYGLIKKVVRADPRVSVAVETLLALPFAAGYVIMLEVLDQGNFLNHGTWHALLLLLAGPVTAVPLLLFAAAAQRLPMVTLGLLFYLNPGLQMAWGVLIGHEPMPVGRWIGFALIWVALVIMTVGALRKKPAEFPADFVDQAETESSSR
ncbi:RarD protein [Mycolicibacterium fortuitum subsp. fortuitum DSM 46621 = ATCC 6841 = JCM 6387]|uniref:RarD protein n=1 Tax=Mycolicibacterium fortuitum subsp. fortuitum DSM 46621 = ATCC 6841 = JCM 6387 TaxID=1214102 RepID=K0VL88_MYCFO|nr:Protein rarD [Mycobacterium sp. VKM Ac-1817D]EJZ15733.1 RarD protein [Mycolicibacterium fortuitum subsp. fortuitum DSM 46621 = ATCC 6841 = JCM 6387]BDD98827.1 protein RarD [Mycolicibacterium fortuitum subsp. fortuitum]CRL56522.1 RarD protein [Mycolicibacterium fortuitum subsp. fortuitum DSM 46621 = ATCC 6841 = JCM 6387]CRL69769.1 RarD protein [Mycolicibacter nonchromogenicus]